MRKNLFLFSITIVFAIICTIVTARAVSASYECGVDPVYDKSFVAELISGARVRNMACMDGSEVLTVLSSGTKVNVIAETDGWYKVKLSDGTTGWVGARLMKKLSDSSEEVSGAIKTTSTESKPSETPSTTSTAIQNNLKGYIVLQVEKRGEAWYVNDDGARFYMKDGSAAYDIMRDLGLGISNSDFSKLEKGDTSLKNRLKGKIVLKVQSRGEAFYISPKDGSLHYLKNGDAAYSVMKSQALGITNEDISKIKEKDIVTYKKELLENKKDTSIKSENGTITLSATTENNSAILSWTVNGMSVPKGFKIVSAKHTQPIYPGDEYVYLSDTASRSYVWKGLPEGTNYIRVCEYLGGSCGVYSNEVSVNITGSSGQLNGSISLSGTSSGGVVKLSWTLDGMDSEKGFKVVVSDDPNPVYPGDEYHYLSNSETRSDEWSDLPKGKTYHFRVCEYLGGKCGIYSNDLSIAN